MVYNQFPCGHCYECLSKKRCDWSIRLQQQLLSSTAAYHAVLTYSDDNLPRSKSGIATVCKRDCQLFIKRLRHEFDNKITYFLAAEYGEYTQRPHYHVALFNVPRCRDIVVRGKYNNEYSEQMRSLVQKAWQLGDVRQKSCYISSNAQLHYLTKDIYNWAEPECLYDTLNRLMSLKKKNKLSMLENFHKNSFDSFLKNGSFDDRTPTFRLMSKNLGLDYIKSHWITLAPPSKELILKYDSYFRPVKFEGKRLAQPVGFDKCGEYYVSQDFIKSLEFDGMEMKLPTDIACYLAPYKSRELRVFNAKGQKREEIKEYPLPRYYRDKLLPYGFRGVLALQVYYRQKKKFNEYINKHLYYDATHEVPYFIRQQQNVYRDAYKSHKDRYSRSLKENLLDSQ